MRERVRSSLVVLRVRGLRECSSTVGRVIVFVRPRVGRTGVTVFVSCGGSGSRGVLDLCLAGAGASDPDSDWPSTVGEATWDWCRCDFGRGLLRAWVVEEVLERGLNVGFTDALDAGLRVAVADLGDESLIDLAFALLFFLIIMLVLTSSLETDTLRLRFRPLHPIAAHDASLSSCMVESARNRARLISVFRLNEHLHYIVGGKYPPCASPHSTIHQEDPYPQYLQRSARSSPTGSHTPNGRRGHSRHRVERGRKYQCWRAQRRKSDSGRSEAVGVGRGC